MQNGNSSFIKVRLLPLALAAALVFLTAACSSDTDQDPDLTNQTSQTTSTQDDDQSLPADPAQPDKAAARTIFEQYRLAWQNQDFSAMYQLLSMSAKGKIDQETFISRYETIISGIQAENIHVTPLDLPPNRPTEDNESVILFQINMDTLAGPVELPDYEMTLIIEGEGASADWRVDWTESLIFPHMQEGDQVRARVLHPRRGEIRDRNNRGLAINDELITIGLVPERFMPVRDEAIPQMAEWLGISEERINQIADKATVADWFYPVVTLPGDQTDLSAMLTSIDGVQFQRTEGRVYPGGAATGLLVGYTGPITAEELERYPDAGYTAFDQIGKMGLELAFEERLRGSRGGEIYLADSESGRVIREIARLEPEHGETILLAIDLTVQQLTYLEMAEEAGSAAILDPRTGEVLALVSTPSFDPNVFQTYIPDMVRQTWNESDKSYFLNRFNSGYAPGSVFKYVTAAIGLKNDVTDPDEVISISGLHWRPDDGWGTYRITRVRDISQVDLHVAMLNSDNIYFAMQAMNIGRDRFEQGAAAFGIGERLPGSYPFYQSQLSNDGLSRQTLIADTGYGQGEILITSLHLGLIYSTMATKGNLMMPIFELSEDIKPAVWHENAVRPEDVTLLRDLLLQVIEDPAGSGYTDPPSSNRMLGKTGTAELKTDLDDEDAQENGWFIAMDAENDTLVIAMMIEDVKGRGGSRYVVPFVKRLMDTLLAG